MAMSPGTIVGGYRIQRLLGQGGMGAVYLAKHPSLPRMDAVKVLSAEMSNDTEFRGRFEREANLVAALDHPNIVSVYNRGEEDGQLWIAMQYVDGTDCSAELARDPHSMTPLRVLRIITEVGKGLDYAHRRGLLHRDIKPANFLLSKSDDDEERVFLADFGVAKSDDDTNELTQTGSFVATIAYAPPEQLQGGSVDHRGDIYSLACSFYKLLTGQNPYPATQPAMVMMGHLYEPPPRPTAVSPHLPAGLDQLFAKAMAKNPADRFNTCREFTDAATKILIPGYQASGSHTAPSYPIQTYAPGSGTDPRVVQVNPTTGSYGGPTGAYPQNYTQTGNYGQAANYAQAGNQAQTGSYSPAGGQTPPGGYPQQASGSTGKSTSLTLKPATSPRRNILIGVGAAVVVVLAVVIGIVATKGGGSNNNTASPSSATAAPTVAAGTYTSPEQAAAANPVFKGKTLTVVDVSNNDKMAIYLSGTPQTQFLQALGFVYNLNYTKSGDEPSPRPLADNDYNGIEVSSDSYIIAVRSDAQAGNGGLLGLPYQLSSSRATVIPLDDPTAVSAMRNWSPTSQQTLLDKLVPVLSHRIAK